MRNWKLSYRYYRFALLRRQLARAYEEGDEALMRRLSRMLDEAQLQQWQAQQERKDAAI